MSPLPAPVVKFWEATQLSHPLASVRILYSCPRPEAPESSFGGRGQAAGMAAPLWPAGRYGSAFPNDPSAHSSPSWCPKEGWHSRALPACPVGRVPACPPGWEAGISVRASQPSCGPQAPLPFRPDSLGVLSDRTPPSCNRSPHPAFWQGWLFCHLCPPPSPRGFLVSRLNLPAFPLLLVGLGFLSLTLC